MCTVHPLSHIHPEAHIGENVEVGPFTHIYGDVEIGDGTWIGSNVTIMDGARIGKNCRIFPGAVISAIPQDLKFAGEKTTVKVGDNTTIREFVTLNRGTKARGETTIGCNCLLMAYVHVAHDCVIGNNVILANTVNLAGHIEIDDWAIVGGMTAVHQFSKIGAHSMISGGSLVRKDVPPYIKAAREPLSYAGVNSIGLRRRGFSAEQIAVIQQIYRILYLQGHIVSKAVKIIEETIPECPERDHVLRFIREAASRGIIKGPGTHPVSDE
ncbi:MAG: acyl-ACP--UDP-N-acetylglucosamine O-acyltransferase [Bacteroidales bacterium]|nr:acyl-ACP--UDP-N-acetylglucosamine O-acyltransferase [Bacteroidales bacterium]